MKAERSYEAAACGWKERFETWALVLMVAKRRRQRGRPSKPYHCQACHGWHIATPSKRSRRINRVR